MVTKLVQFVVAILLILLVAMLLAPRLVEVARVNAWSRAYLEHEMAGGEAPGDAPAGHARAALWRAREALYSGDPEQALLWLGRTPEQVRVEALELSGLAREQLRDFRYAVRDWVRARDWRNLRAAAGRAQTEGRLDDALYAFRALQVIDPEAGVLPFANFLWWPYGSQDAAIATLNRALAQFPHSEMAPKWLIRRGDFRRYLQNWEAAEADYRRALTLDPRAWGAFIGIGWARYGRGKGIQVAASEFEHAIQVAPNNPGGYRAMAQLYLKEGRWPEADLWYQRALEQAPEDRWLWLERAKAARDHGDLPVSIEIYQQVVDRWPDWAQAYYEFAWAWKQMAQPSEAIKAIERAIALADPPSAAYYLRAGRIYEDAGQADTALAHYRKALALAPTNAQVRQAIERLTSGAGDG